MQRLEIRLELEPEVGEPPGHRELPPHDTLYMRRDITRQSGIDSWIK